MSFRKFFSFTACLAFLSVAAATASASIILQSRNAVHFKLSGEGEHKGSITIKNTGSKPEKFSVVLVDFLYDYTGHNEFPPIGTAPRSLGDNLSLAPREGTLAPGEVLDIAFTYTGSEGLSGTYWSCALIRHGPGWEVERPSESEERGLVIRQRMQYAVPISCTYPSEEGPDVKVLGRSIIEDERSGHQLVFDLQNAGDVAIDPEGRYEIFSAEGNSVFKGSLKRQKLYPTTSVRFALPLKDINAGQYFAVAYFEDGDESFALQYTFDFKP